MTSQRLDIALESQRQAEPRQWQGCGGAGPALHWRKSRACCSWRRRSGAVRGSLSICLPSKRNHSPHPGHTPHTPRLRGEAHGLRSLSPLGSVTLELGSRYLLRVSSWEPWPCILKWLSSCPLPLKRKMHFGECWRYS